MCSRSVNALLRCSIKRSTLIANSSLEDPLPRDGWTEDVVEVLIASTYDYIWSTCLGLFSTWMLVIIYLQCPRARSYMFRLVHATPVHPSLCLPHSNPTVTVTVTIARVSLLLLLLQTEGFCSIVNQKNLRMRTRKPRSNLGDVINEREMRFSYP